MKGTSTSPDAHAGPHRKPPQQLAVPVRQNADRFHQQPTDCLCLAIGARNPQAVQPCGRFKVNADNRK